MKERKDILFENVDGSYDLAIRDGDFFIGISDEQHINHMLEGCPSQYREHPLAGCCIRKMLNGSLEGAEIRRISMQLKSDGYNVVNIQYDGEKLMLKL